MNLRVGPIQIFVSDVEKSKQWYFQVLGMKLIEEHPEFRCVLMKLNNIEFDIGTPMPKWGKGWDRVKIGGRTNIFFETKDIKRAVEELKEKGAKFIEEISKRSWGEYKAVFIDLDGNEFNLIEVK